MKRSQYLLQDKPWLLKIFGSKNPIMVIIFSLPILVFLLNKLSNSKENISSINLLLSFLIGLIVWSFLEYSIHRNIYHHKLTYKKFRYFIGAFHLYHHQNKFDLRVLNAGPMMTYPLSFLLLSPIYFLSNSWEITASYGLGLLLYYIAYECVHYLIHYKKFETGYMAYIQKYHFHHHDHAPLKNFGNTSHLWDRLLGTYDKRYKEYQMPKETYQSLITTQNNNGELCSI